MKYALAAFALIWPVAGHAEQATDYVVGCSIGQTEDCLRGAQLAQAAGDIPLLTTFSIQGCEAGEIISCSDEGMLIITGQSNHGSLADGVALVQKGCEGGYSRACANLGYLLYTGTGVRINVADAAYYYQLGCEGGSGPACLNLARMVYDGEVQPDSVPDIPTLLDRACELGEVSACG